MNQQILTNQPRLLCELAFVLLGHRVELLNVHSDAVLLWMYVKVSNFCVVSRQLRVEIVLNLGTSLQTRVEHLFWQRNIQTASVGADFVGPALSRCFDTDLPQNVLDSCDKAFILLFVELRITILSPALILVIFLPIDTLITFDLQPVRCAAGANTWTSQVAKRDDEAPVLALSFLDTVAFHLLLDVIALGADRDLVGKFQVELAQIYFK